MTDFDKYTFNIKDLVDESDVGEDKNLELINSIVSAKTKEEKDTLAWQLTRINSPLIIHTVERYFKDMKGSPNWDDMLSDGMMGLFKACRKVKIVESNHIFASYAIKYIFGYIMNGSKRRSGQIRLPKAKESIIRHDEKSIDSEENENMKYSLQKALETRDTEDKILKKSDGEFCKLYFKSAKKHHNKKLKKYHRKMKTFYSKENIKILKGLGEHDVAELSEIIGKHKQQIEMAKQYAFLYMVHYLKECEPKERKEFFNIVYGGTYSLKNPPPFKGWRKDIWDKVIDNKTKNLIHARRTILEIREEKRKRKNEKGNS